MENTLENKAKFFSQYWGQNVLTRPNCGNKKWIIGEEVSIQSSLSKFGYDYQYFLELKPLTSITDEDVKECFNIGQDFNDDMRVINFEPLEGLRDFLLEEWITFLPCSDFLRSKGYALPWMGLSVETMVKYGWIKLAE